MSDISKAAIAAAVMGGYALGRTRKGRLALTAVTFVVGRRFLPDPKRMLAEGVRQLTQTPQFAQLSEQVRGQLMDAARSAARGMFDRGLDSLADNLEQRTAALEQDKKKPESEEAETASEESAGAETATPEAQEDTSKAASTSEETSEERKAKEPRAGKQGTPDGGKATSVAERKPGAKRTEPAARETSRTYSAPRNSTRKRTLAHADRK